jgi:hypothetical protein
VLGGLIGLGGTEFRLACPAGRVSVPPARCTEAGVTENARAWRRPPFRRSLPHMRTYCSLNRRFLFLLALLAAAATAQQPAIAATAPATRDLVLHAELSARTLPPGAPLRVGVQMRNVSDHEVAIADNVMAQGCQGFKVEVTTLDGQPVPVSQ